MVEKHKAGSILWTLQQNISAKKLLIQSADDDIKRAQKRREDATLELADNERAYGLLLDAETGEAK